MRVVFVCCIHWHQITVAMTLKSMTSEVEQSICFFHKKIAKLSKGLLHFCESQVDQRNYLKFLRNDSDR